MCFTSERPPRNTLATAPMSIEIHFSVPLDLRLPNDILGPVPERKDNSIPGINVPYSKDNFIPGITSVPERRNSAIQEINLG